MLNMLIKELNEHERDKLSKLLMNAYIELCRAEKLLKGSDSDGKRAEPKADKG